MISLQQYRFYKSVFRQYFRFTLTCSQAFAGIYNLYAYDGVCSRCRRLKTTIKTTINIKQRRFKNGKSNYISGVGNRCGLAMIAGVGPGIDKVLRQVRRQRQSADSLRQRAQLLNNVVWLCGCGINRYLRSCCRIDFIVCKSAYRTSLIKQRKDESK